jgi:hypothetical protein
MKSKPIIGKEKPDVKKQIQSSRKLSAKMKEEILKYITSSSRYDNGRVFGLIKPSGMGKISSKISGCSMGADKDGFFVYTHRARCKSFPSPMKITKKCIDFIESTG